MDDARVLAYARMIVRHEPTRFGYVDVGDALVAYLQGRKSAAETLETLQGLEVDYERERTREARVRGG